MFPLNLSIEFSVVGQFSKILYICRSTKNTFGKPSKTLTENPTTEITGRVLCFSSSRHFSYRSVRLSIKTENLTSLS